MHTQTNVKQSKVRQICENIFETKKYFPRTSDEASLLQTLGFELERGSLVLPKDIEYLDRTYIEKELRRGGEFSKHKVLVENCVGSTNQELLHLAKHSDISNTVMFTELQIDGRGRFGRAWQSPLGRNLALSLGVRITRTPANPGMVSLIIGVTIANVLEELEIGSVSLKWPNDILFDGKKVGGILIDVGHVLNPVELVVGIGLNVGGGTLVRELVGQSVADLADYCSVPLRNKLAVSTVRNIRKTIQTFETDGFQSFHDRWSELDVLRGKPVKVSTQQDCIHGIARGIKDTGELCIELKNGKSHYVIAGEVSLREQS